MGIDDKNRSGGDSSNNPLLERGPLPPFDRIDPSHLEPAVRSTLQRCEAELEQIEAAAQNGPVTWQLIEQLNALTYDLHRTWGPAQHLISVKNSPALRQAYEEVEGDVVRFGLRLSQSRSIFRALEQLEQGPLSPLQKRIVELRLRSARKAGVGLEGKERSRFNHIATEVSRLAVNFANHLLDSTKAFSLILTEKEQVEGLPLSALQLAAQSYNTASDGAAGNGAAGDATGDAAGNRATAEGGPWRIGLDPPSYMPFMEHAVDRSLRERLYRAFITRASVGKEDNLPLIQRILELRWEQARLLGYSSFAELIVENRMAEKVDSIYSLIEDLHKGCGPQARRELEELEDLARSCGQSEPLAHWDIPFWAERLRERRFGFTDEELRPYFPLPQVLAGLFQLSEHLFGIRVERAEGQAPIWHPDVGYFLVRDEAGELLASFYLDPYSRPESKRGGAWMDDCIGRRLTAAGIEKPVAYLVCNAMPPMGERPSLMNFNEVSTLFHEFGHGLQHLLTEIDAPEVAGINGVEWDAVELPSQFMENWCYQRSVLKSLSAHVESGESLPDDLCEKLAETRRFRAASAMSRQISFALVDMELHYRYDPIAKSGSKSDAPKGDSPKSDSLLQLVQDIRSEFSLLPPLPEDRFLCSFAHIFAGGYAAGYYSYKWAEVLSAEAFGAFEEAGLENRRAISKTGHRFRKSVLALGGSRHAAQIFHDFLGRKASINALLRQAGLVADSPDQTPKEVGNRETGSGAATAVAAGNIGSEGEERPGDG